MWFRKPIALLFALSIILAVWPAHAQEDPTPILDRLQRVSEWTPQDRVISLQSSDSNITTINFGGQEFNQTSTYTLTATETTVNVDQDNESRQIEFSLAGNEVDTDNNTISYVIEGEMRFVEGRVYLNAAYLNSQGDVPDLPDGWFEITDAAAWDIFNPLNIDNLLETEDEDTTDFEAFQDFVKFFTDDPLATATSTATTLDDGSAADILTVTLSTVGFSQIIQEQVNEDIENGEIDTESSDYLIQQAIYDNLTDETYTSIALTLTPDNIPLSGVITVNFATAPFALAAIDPENFPEGITASVLGTAVDTYEFVSYDTGLAPIEAPELAE